MKRAKCLWTGTKLTSYFLSQHREFSEHTSRAESRGRGGLQPVPGCSLDKRAVGPPLLQRNQRSQTDVQLVLLCEYHSAGDDSTF